MKKIITIANTIIESGMSGGNRIFIEIDKRWIKKGIRFEIFTSNVGEQLCKDNELDVLYHTWHFRRHFLRFGLIFSYIISLLKGFYVVIKEYHYNENDIIYSSSDFWPDFFPALFLKMFYKNVKWIASFYLFAPYPFDKKSPYKGKNTFKGFLYWISQLPVYFIIKKYADMVFVTNEPDKLKFLGGKLSNGKVIAVHGGIDMEVASLVQEPLVKNYDAVFVGRLHPQKGVIELIEIWNIVCKKRNQSKLAIIGIGESENMMKKKIYEYKLENNIKLLGFLDGIEKIKILKRSKIGVYPATLDHWSIAPVELMSCGLPLATFDVPTLYFLNPSGMIRIKPYDISAFAFAILDLLDNEERRKKLGEDALKWAKQWDWNARSEEIFAAISENLINNEVK
ncbi:MAG: glycosyltransferase family 4 protein [Nitrososphaerota archaeon]|nr:glycosyltransferase family 4 protein [Nitrososphaerota archaeon]